MLALSCFLVGANAASSNNILNTDITQWTKSTSTVISSYSSNIFRIFAQPSDFSEVVEEDDGRTAFGAYEIPSLTPGHNYTASLKFPSVSEINSALGTSFTEAQILGNLASSGSKLFFGIGYKLPGKLKMPDQFMFKCDGSEFNNYLGQTVTFDFDYSTLVNTGEPVFIIGISKLNSDTTDSWIYVSNPVLIDNDADGSEGFLSNLLEFLQEKFGSIGTGLSNVVNSLVTLKNSISDKLAEVKQGIADSIFNAFDSLGIDLEGWFNDVGSWFDNLKNSISEFFSTLWENFSAFFEKFKPRVYEQLIWQRGMINGTTGAILNQPNGQNVIVSEFFEVPLGTEYLLDYFDTDHNGALQIYQYNLDESYVGSLSLINSDTEGYILPEGYLYRFRLVLNLNYKPSEANNIVKIYADEGWLNALVHLLISKIKALFIPDPNALTEFYDEMELFMQEHLGIIYEATTLSSELIQTLGDMLSGGSSAYDLNGERSESVTFTLPAILIPLPGDNEIPLWSKQEFNLDLLFQNDFFNYFYGLYKMILWVICIFATIKYAIKTWERIIGA